MGPLIPNASVLIGPLDSVVGHPDRAIDAVDRADRANQELFVPASAYGEALVAFARASRARDAREAIAGRGIVVVPVTGLIAERAAELRAAHGSLRLPEALVLATAHEHEGELLTYDDRLAQTARQSKR